jgi:glycosyltransferase involved in cell wall biosynthesis
LKYIIQATNIHKGGGLSLLLLLLKAFDGKKCVVLLDARLSLNEIPEDIEFLQFSPTLYGRLSAELYLWKNTSLCDIVLCFGNLPPLIKNRGKVFVFVQNRFIFGAQSLSKFALRTHVRLKIERMWFFARLRKKIRIIVQTPTMSSDLKIATGRSSVIIPFADTTKFSKAVKNKLEYDFIYVATDEPHKNHKRLIEAWKILGRDGVKPSLCLTIDPKVDTKLVRWIFSQISEWNLDIKLVGYISSVKIVQYYAVAGALIYPSTLESFGLPLLESKAMGLPIVASELDYVRDVVEPVQTFDPFSEVSIARAVKRYLNLQNTIEIPVTADDLLDYLNKDKYDIQK